MHTTQRWRGHWWCVEHHSMLLAYISVKIRSFDCHFIPPNIQIYFHAFMELNNSFSTVSIDCRARTPTEIVFLRGTCVFKRAALNKPLWENANHESCRTDWSTAKFFFLNSANSVSSLLESDKKAALWNSQRTHSPYSKTWTKKNTKIGHGRFAFGR